MIRRVALTGGVASGKSTAARELAELGVPVIDTDRIARDLTAPGAPLVREICARLGPGLCTADGRLDRRELRSRIFTDPTLRSRLEAILHPVIAATMDREVEALPQSIPYVILVIPLLLETGWQDRVDVIVVVDCSPDVQIERLLQRDHIPDELAHAMLAAQASREQRLAAADYVLTNSRETTVENLREQVRGLNRILSGCSPH